MCFDAVQSVTDTFVAVPTAVYQIVTLDMILIVL